MMQIEDILLRPITLEATQNIIQWRNSDFVRKHFVYQKEFTKESHEEWMNTMVSPGKVAQFIIHAVPMGKDIGSVFLRDIDPIHQKAEFGIFVGDPAARGKGFGTMAAKGIIQFGFEKLQLHKIFLRVFAENPAAIASYQKAGFIIEGHMVDDVCIDGEFKDMIFMGILNPRGKQEVKR
ncbi:MAG: GNAT family N-acetyltransferase [Clostridiales bacterium]|nr:GNAT family N-acetyltransferase [Clostridiales bacterium]